MLTALWLAVATASLAWVVLLTARGGFWRADQRLEAAPAPPDWPEVAALIPARNEAAVIGATLESLADSRYPGRLSIIVIDDGSTDGTAEAARRIAPRAGRPVRVLDGAPLAAGWSGKLWALHQAVVAAPPLAAWLLFTDADITHHPDTLARMVAKAAAERLDMVSLMARLDADGFWARLLVPAFVFFFQKLYPFPWVNDPAHRMAGAAGGCMLIRRAALEAAGGVASVRGALIDDCALARRLKAEGGRLWLGLADDEVISRRPNDGLAPIWRMVARTAFVQLRRSWLLLAGCVAGMAVLYLAGPVAALAWPAHGEAGLAAAGAFVWALSATAYAPTLRLYGQPSFAALALPLAAFLYVLMTVDSARRDLAGGAEWKGRRYGKAQAADAPTGPS